MNNETNRGRNNDNSKRELITKQTEVKTGDLGKIKNEVKKGV